MQALSPPLFSATYGWPLNDPITQQDSNDISTANSYHSHVDFPTYDQIKQDSAPENFVSSGGKGNGGTRDATAVVRKLNHNATERNRRKRVNDLYLFLRSLLPMSIDPKDKESTPGIASCALKYIPQLQKEVNMLMRRKEKLRSYSLMQEQSITKPKSSMIRSMRALGVNEVVIQLISSAHHMSQNKEICVLSKVLEYLDKEEDGLVLLNLTTFKCSQGVLLNTLHLQEQGEQKIDAERLKEKLYAFQQS